MLLFETETFTIFQSQLYKTNSTVIHTEDCIIVVDPTWLPQEVIEIQSYVQKLRENKPLYLLFTHSDWDHIIGYGAFPNCKVIASEEFATRSDQEEILEQIRSFDDEYYLDRNYPVVYPKVDIPVSEEGQILQIGKTTMTFYKAKGHTCDGLFAVVEPCGVWLGGDYLSDVEFPYIYYSSVEYEHTLGKVDSILERHLLKYFVPGHGNYTESYHEILRRQADSLKYIRQLRKSIIAGVDSEYLITNYLYPRNMKKFHRENVKLIEKELTLLSHD